jgi:hypothetical protein
MITSNGHIPLQNKRKTANAQAPKDISIVSKITSGLSDLSSVSLVNSENVEFEGESSLHAHSIAARDHLEQTLGNHSYVRDDPKMIAALRSLRHIVKTDNVEPSQRRPKLTGLGGSRQAIYELTLPPTNAVLDLLRKSKGKSSSCG